MKTLPTPRTKVMPGIFSITIACLTLTAIGCKENIVEEKITAFSMSDTMMARCEFVKARLEEVKNEIRLFGKITADNNKMAQVYPIVSGVVTSIHVELGDYVKQGQVLASIQSSEVATFQKEKLDALNDVAIAEKNLQVANDLFEGKLNSEKDVSAAERELEKAKAELARINEIYTIYNLKSGSVFNVVAPISGFVVTKKINQNEQIRIDNTEPVFSIADINEVWALANVNESDIAKIQVGYDVTVRTLAFPEQPFTGKIDKIFNAIDPQTKSMKVRVKIPNTDLKLKPEMNCTVSVHFTNQQKLIAIPAAAIIFDKSKHWVMVFKDRHNIETRRIEPVSQLGETSYIKSGVSEGETVIAKNGLLIYDALND
ncbi:MAG: efflux RND transporter periplasmic adaptor subunit [Cyclobacteriaceae bacterium]|nr:efflux RND transporter periplasmic adaptor subunit [Cyclobacteriaceae bacterium]